jgi:hypothetical protein
MSKRQTFIVLVLKGPDQRAFGPYYSFIRASQDAQAIPPHKGSATVIQIEAPEYLP